MLLDPVRLAKAGRAAGDATLGALRRGGLAWWRRRLVADGVDDTAGSAGRSAVVVTAQPEEAVLACGAAVARKRAAGSDVAVVVVTDGRPPSGARGGRIPGDGPPRAVVERRARHARAAWSSLGVAEGDVTLLGFEAGTLWRNLDELADGLAELVRGRSPDEVLVPAGLDGDDDRRAVSAALGRAAAGLPAAVLAYPLPAWLDGPWRASPEEAVTDQARELLRAAAGARALPRAALVSTDGHAGRKARALACFAPGCPGGDGAGLPGTGRAALGAWEALLPLGHPLAAPAAAPAPAARNTAPAHAAPAATAPALASVRDDFADDRPPGGVLGTRATSGAERLGVDVERTLSIDDGELRMATLASPGFGRQGLAFGPFARTAGLTLTVQVLNSHNTAQSNILPEGRKAMARRLLRNFPHGKLSPPHIDDNLAVGFFTSPAPADPRDGGNAFVMHAASTVNGELRARVAGGLLRAYRGVQEVPLTYVVVLRERGATYCVSSLPGAEGAGPFPAMRPVAVDRSAADGVVFAGVMQAVHGEVGHEISTRVAAVRTEVVPELAGGAATRVADPLDGEGRLDGTAPGGTGAEAAPWALEEGCLDRGPGGASGRGAVAAATTVLPWPAGLVHVAVGTSARGALDARAGLLWRAGPAGAFRVVLADGLAEVAHRGADGGWAALAEGPARLAAGGTSSLQVVDDGRQFGVHLDGTLLFDRWFDDDRLSGQLGAGVLAGDGAHCRLRDFEALPRELPLPPFDLAAPWCARGELVVAEDDFSGPPGELDGRWERSVGEGSVVRTGSGTARVAADARRPNPGRTAYTLPWHDPTFADVEVVMTPPGRGRGEGEAGRGGLVLFESPGTYVVVNVWLDDAPIHDGSSVSLFLRAGGRERLYDAVWTNVGRRVTWGRTVSLRLASDGVHLLAWLDGTPVLFRRARDIHPGVAPLRITRVGLVANWEWGDDTGTVFHRFTARARGTT